VSHVSLDPLRRDQLAVLPLHRFRAAIVLADEAWSGSETLEEGLDGQRKTIVASDMIDQPSVLRQDALMVMVQVRTNGYVNHLCVCQGARGLGAHLNAKRAEARCADVEKGGALQVDTVTTERYSAHQQVRRYCRCKKKVCWW
jgi:hypothetical protein